MHAEVITNIGLVRKNNEDAAWSDLKNQFFVVADGMGGYVAGEVASVLAIDSLKKVLAEELNEAGDSPSEILRQAFYQANDRIYQEAREHSEYAGMGTTLTALWIVGNKAYIAHVGDSRVYLIREGKIKTLTLDHSLVGELVREGGLTEEQARNHPQKNVLTRALGCSALVEVDITEVDTFPGDYFLLCTDGLSNLVSAAEMLDIVTPEKKKDRKRYVKQDMKVALQNLLDLALARGGYDNITAILVNKG
ncbi:MAG: Stp1/IreP family PP2C-type Ser/Thr phosphatase [Bacillota bacterium]|jgi:serine/threonine protein phosphatase PrpC